MMEYCSAIKRNILLTLAASDYGRGSRRSHTGKATYPMIPFIGCSEKKNHRDKEQTRAHQGLRAGRGV